MLLVDALDAGRDKVIVLVGGGGKTTTMYRLARELADSGARVVVTTTTRINVPRPEEAGCTLVARDLEVLRSLVRDSLKLHQIVGVGYYIVDEGKLKGIPPEWVAELASLADHVLVEADGSAGRPFKAPADHEPVIPDSTDLLIAVVGVEAVGARLTREDVHRPERIEALTGLRPGEVITPAVVARVLLHPWGITKGRPRRSRTVALINKVDDERRLGTAREIGQLLVEGGIRRVVVASVRSEPPVVGTMQ